MTSQQLFVLIFTFIVGMAAGGYMYVTGFATEYKDTGVAEAQDVDLTIIAEQVGGCQMGGVCPSFRLTSDRRYTYIPQHGLDADTPAATEGRISQGVFVRLIEIMNETDFASLNQTNDVCQAAFDGIDYRYQITFNGENYELNSCGTTFYGTRLYNQLLLLWSEMLRAEATGAEEVQTPSQALR